MTSTGYALVVIDMQEHFRGIAEPIISELNHTIEACHLLGIPVIFTQHGHPDPRAEEQTNVLVKWWGAQDSIKFGSKSWRLLPEVHRSKADTFITSKQTYDAFHKTELEEVLEACGVGQLIISGVMTNCCCETTARSAFVKNYDVTFLSDGTATSSEEMHRATLLNIGVAFGRVLTCAELRDEVKVAAGEAEPD
ncbi:hypothetical protein N2152v2_010302 [Parachlorella kessleri]